MKKVFLSSKSKFLFFFLVLSISVIPDQARAENRLAHDNYKATLWMYTSGEYAASTIQTYSFTKLKLDTFLEQRDKKQKNLVENEKLAIVVDVDETILDNTPFQANLIISNQDWDKESWENWVAKAEAKAVPGSVL